MRKFFDTEVWMLFNVTKSRYVDVYMVTAPPLESLSGSDAAVWFGANGGVLSAMTLERLDPDLSPAGDTGYGASEDAVSAIVSRLTALGADVELVEPSYSLDDFVYAFGDGFARGGFESLSDAYGVIERRCSAVRERAMSAVRAATV